MTPAQYDEISRTLKEIVQLLKKIEEACRKDDIKEIRSKIRGFANEKDDSPF